MALIGIEATALSPEAAEQTQNRTDAFLAVYGEVCKSYHAIDEFRAKLLGILPIASLAGILLVSNDSLVAQSSPSHRLIGFASFFAAAFTLALFLFEIRGILRCDHLIRRGEALEKQLGIQGQFYVCSLQHSAGTRGRSDALFNAKVAASAIYSLVFSAWIFMALKFTFNFTVVGCGLTATIVGGVLGVGVHALVNRRIAA